VATIDLAELPVREANELLRRYGAEGENVDILDPDARHHIGVGLTSPITVKVHGSAGYFCAGLTDGPRFEVDGNVVDVFVGYLRRKLEAAGEPRILHTKRGAGYVVKAYVVLKPGRAASEALAAELQGHVKRELAPYKYPRRIEFVERLPRTETGKIRRVDLRRQEAERARGRGP